MQPVMWGVSQFGFTAVQNLVQGYFAVPSNNVSVVMFHVPCSGFFSHLYVHAAVPGTGAGTFVYTMFKGTAGTSFLSVSISNTATDGSDLVNVMNVTKGDAVTIHVDVPSVVTSNPGVASPKRVSVTARFTPT